MTFSLIISTLDRTYELYNLLISLKNQTFKNFEVIIVDQNSDEKLVNIIQNFNTLNLTHIKTQKGLSLGRNRGLKYAKGNIIGFPDDDCTYPRDLLEKIYFFFSSNNCDFICGKTIDLNTNKIVAGKSIHKPFQMHCLKFAGSSTSLFINAKNISSDKIKFDEEFGIGAQFLCEEENDLIIRLLKESFIGLYRPDIITVYHPDKYSLADYDQAYSNGYGLGALIGKHFFSYCGFILMIKYLFIRPPVGILLFFLQNDTNKTNYYKKRWFGIWSGFIAYLRRYFFESKTNPS